MSERAGRTARARAALPQVPAQARLVLGVVRVRGVRVHPPAAVVVHEADEHAHHLGGRLQRRDHQLPVGLRRVCRSGDRGVRWWLE